MGKQIIPMMIFLSSTVTFGQQHSWEIQQRFERENEYLDLKIKERDSYLYQQRIQNQIEMDRRKYPILYDTNLVYDKYMRSMGYDTQRYGY